MAQYEYKVIPAPAKPGKVRGASTPQARFARTLAAELNAQAHDGWEFLRAETLPVEERAGLTGTKTSFRSVLIYRRPLDIDESEAAAAALRLLEDRSGET